MGLIEGFVERFPKRQLGEIDADFRIERFLPQLSSHVLEFIPRLPRDLPQNLPDRLVDGPQSDGRGLRRLFGKFLFQPLPDASHRIALLRIGGGAVVLERGEQIENLRPQRNQFLFRRGPLAQFPRTQLPHQMIDLGLEILAAGDAQFGRNQNQRYR